MAEDTNEKETRLEMLALTSDIVSAHVSNNPVSGADLPLLMERVFATLTGLGNAAAKEPAEELKPAVPIRRSVTPDYLICLEDGKKLKMLKRHLRTAYDSEETRQAAAQESCRRKRIASLRGFCLGC